MYERILVAVDGSPTSKKAVTAALEMASYSAGRSVVRLIHVLDDMAYLMGLDPYAIQSYSVISLMQKTGEKILADDLAIVDSAGVQADTVLVDGSGLQMAEAIAGEAEKWNASIIVVGTHGRRGVRRMLMGSGAEHIIRLAPCPVLVVRSTQESLTQ